MRPHARGFVELVPFGEIFGDIAGKVRDEGLDPDVMDQPHHVVDADERYQRARGGFEHYL